MDPDHSKLQPNATFISLPVERLAGQRPGLLAWGARGAQFNNCTLQGLVTLFWASTYSGSFHFQIFQCKDAYCLKVVLGPNFTNLGNVALQD